MILIIILLIIILIIWIPSLSSFSEKIMLHEIPKEVKVVESIIKYEPFNSDSSKIIIPDIVGGLGNQLFIVASAFAFAKDNNYIIMLDNRNDVSSYGKARPTYNDTVFTKIPVTDIDINKFTRLNEYNFLSENIINEINNNVFLTGGYYQQVKYFDKYRNELLNLLEPTDETLQKVNNIFTLNNINLTDNLIAIHIRLDDIYTPIDGDKRVYDQDEYDLIINKLPEHLNNNQNTKFIIFSNDIPRTKDIFSKALIENSKMIYIEAEDYVELSLMARCNEYIASPSTFNWWGIYLNKNKENAKIYIYWKQDSDYRKDFYIKYKYFSNLINTLSNQKLVFITFGGPTENFHKRVKELTLQVGNFNIFNDIIGFTETDLKNDNNFWNKHGEFLNNNERGYGYWLWKSYIILKTLNQLNNNDIIIYSDVGCHFNINEKDKLIEYINILNNSNYGILSFQMNWQEKQWNKGDLFKYFNENNIDIEKINIIKNSGQHHATFMLIKKNDHSINLINKWYELCSNYNFIDDSPSIENNDSEFIEHRHDQSIFSLLIKIHGSEVLPAGSPVIIDYRDKGL